MTLPVPHLICFALYSTHHAMQQVYKPLLAEFGITYPQYLALSVLWTTGDQTVGQIGQALQLETNTVTPLLKRLEVMGMITRRRDTGDVRQVRISLTAAGVALQKQTAHFPQCLLEKCDMALGELEALRDGILGLRENLLAKPD